MNAEPTRYAFKNGDGHRLEIEATGNRQEILVSIQPIGSLCTVSITIPNNQAPAAALAILTAAGFKPWEDLAAVYGTRESVGHAACLLTEWVREEEHRAKERELTRRRDELACELAGDGAYAYRFASADHQRAIDMIIRLQDEAAGK